MSSQTPSRTRKRTRQSNVDASSPEAASAQPQPDNSFWPENGDVVLSAEMTAFHVHRSVLSQCSDVFREILALPPSKGEIMDMFEGHSLVRLSDQVEDVHILLGTLYQRHRYLPCARPQLTPKVFGILLRLSHKYKIEDILRDIMATLALSFDCTLDRFQYLVDSDGDENMRLAPLPGTGIILANSLEKLLPPEVIMSEFVHENGKVEKLHTKNLLRYINGRAQLAYLYTELLRRTLNPKFAEDCEGQSTSCVEVLTRSRSIAQYEHSRRGRPVFSVLQSFLSEKDLKWLEDNQLCARCLAKVREKDKEDAVWRDVRKHLIEY
ncbi:uncharacterized protein FIBRA_03919 [Fibroporia radiculosa]|uniref:BTB domain-containing protein n=1 Tax=Fibroporia radiculosa TaxID=599839 RepID=J4G6J7_9APHY|nr:uncharacterized protein FIBRA_03919 [Fibroporia radiculosa]CCM01848.1 predicted protein [Fibroporia radiculosa]